jgi:hypothetical protein
MLIIISSVTLLHTRAPLSDRLRLIRHWYSLEESSRLPEKFFPLPINKFLRGDVEMMKRSGEFP